MNKDKIIKARVSANELEMIDERAKVLKISRSKYIRQSALHYRVIVVGREELRAVKTDLRKIGNNLNQIAVLCNMGKITCVHIEDAKTALDKIWSEIHIIRDNVKKLNSEA